MAKKSRQKKASARDYKGMPRIEPPVVRQDFLGTQKANGEPSHTFDLRRTRCFELATYAVTMGTAPAGSRLVHGSWHGPGARERISHAWVELPGGFVWEPITCNVYEQSSFEHWTACWPERTYSVQAARQMVSDHQTYGAWHPVKYPTTKSSEEQESA